MIRNYSYFASNEAGLVRAGIALGSEDEPAIAASVVYCAEPFATWARLELERRAEMEAS